MAGVIRPATPADAPSIAAIWNHYIRSTTVTFTPVEKTTAEVAALTTAPHAFFVADVSGQITGFARHGQFRTGQGYARAAEHTILLAPDAPRGQGTGRALLQAILDDATARGIGAMIAAISGDNAQGLAFHAAMGFATIGLLPAVGWKFGRWHDLLLMQKRLAPSLAPG
jgi:phosphinothricin acetyltransferase